MDWDPEVESPATIAIIGAGPIGVEAALYARFLGYSILLFDQTKVASGPIRWGNRLLSSNVSQCTTSLGHAALAAQNASYSPPALDYAFTGAEFASRYIIPIAKTDLLYDDVHVHSRVVDVSRVRHQPSDIADLQARCNDEFRLVIDSRKRSWWSTRADVILDCTGTATSRDGLGPGGGQAIHEATFAGHILSELPDMLGARLATFANKHTLVVGTSFDAQQAVLDWHVMAQNAPQSRLTWIAPESPIHDGNLSALIQSCKSGALQDRIAVLNGLGIERLDRSDTGIWTVQILLTDDSTVPITCDVLLALTTRRKDWSHCRSLRVAELTHFDDCGAYSPSQSSDPGTTPSSQSSTWPAWRLACAEPNYYVLGLRPNEWNDLNPWPAIHAQIRDLFAMLGGRQTLDLYN